MSDTRNETELRRAFERAGEKAQAEGQAAEESIDILTFSLSGEWYGFRLRDLVEITGGTAPTPIPFTPDFLPGVINHRGRVVPVVNLKKVFGLSGRFSPGIARIVLVRYGSSEVGFIADAISQIETVSPGAIEPPLSTIERGKAEYIEGCIRLSRGLLVLLDSRALVEELRSREEA